jgi:type 1 glutamine amidotransferase
MKRLRPFVVSLTAIFAASSAFVLLTSVAQAAEPKRIVVCTVTTGFRHSSIAEAEKTLQKLADETKAYTIVDFVRQPELQVPKKPGAPKALKPDADDKAKARFEQETKKFQEALVKWTPEMEAAMKAAQAEFDTQVRASLAKLSPANLNAQKIDGVIFANTTGDLPLPDRDGFIQWIKDGHAFMGMHSASDTLHPFPGYIDMLQGEFQTHQAQVPADLVAGDTAHPANAGIGAKWDIQQEEMYLIKSQDRAKVRALWFLRHHPNDVKELGHFPVSWCRQAEKGRVFYTSLGHREDLWNDDPSLKDRKNSPELSKQYQAHILGGIKWALGLVEGSAAPNPEVQ